eukprot:1511665-Amphidinium_carterae.2
MTKTQTRQKDDHEHDLNNVDKPFLLTTTLPAMNTEFHWEAYSWPLPCLPVVKCDVNDLIHRMIRVYVEAHSHVGDTQLAPP